MTDTPYTPASATHIARRNLRETKEARDDEIEAAVAAIKAKWEERVDAAYRHLKLAERAEEDERLAAAQHHPLLGKTVTRTTTKRIARSWCDVEQRGIVEVRTRDTVFPANGSSWDLLPDVGQPFVRLLKADGTPGLKWERLILRVDGAYNWKEA